MKHIIIASRNRGKIAEIRDILSGLPFEIISLHDVPGLPEILEDGATLEENALKKARGIFAATNIPSLGDDTGLEVFSLDLRPGVFSARYAGETATYEDNNRKLLRELAGKTGMSRDARFRCMVAFVDGSVEKLAEGICRGRIGEEIRGKGGFGYDPLFIPEGYSDTFAELALGIKNTISHRAKALLSMKSFLAGYARVQS